MVWFWFNSLSPNQQGTIHCTRMRMVSCGSSRIRWLLTWVRVQNLLQRLERYKYARQSEPLFKLASINGDSEVFLWAAPARSPPSVQYIIVLEYITPDDIVPSAVPYCSFSNSFDNALSQIQSPCSNPVSGTDAWWQSTGMVHGFTLKYPTRDLIQPRDIVSPAPMRNGAVMWVPARPMKPLQKHSEARLVTTTSSCVKT